MFLASEPDKLLEPSISAAGSRKNSSGTVEPLTSYQLQLPEDRPFGNILHIDATTPVPIRFQQIMDSGSNPAEKAERLRSALRHDNRMMGCYTFLLCSFAAYTLFYAVRDPKGLTTAQVLQVSIAFPVSLAFGMRRRWDLPLSDAD